MIVGCVGSALTLPRREGKPAGPEIRLPLRLVPVASLILGIIGSVTGIGALAWQFYTWARSGPVITVSTSQGFPVHGNRLGEQTTGITARNSGRAPITVNSWGLRLPDGQNMVVLDPLPGSAGLPTAWNRVPAQTGTSPPWQ